MKSFSKIAFVCGSLFLGMSMLVGCEDERFSEIDSPDWLSELVDSLSSTTSSDVEEIDGYEDVYTIGETDYSSSWWTAFSKYYQVPDGETWQAQFTLNIDPSETLYYENFALVITNDVDRNDSDYKEYGAIRFDATSDTTSYNSQWGSDFWSFYFSFTSATLLFSPDADYAVTNLSSLGGTVTVTVDRSDPDAFTVTMTNGTQTKTYAQPYALGNLNTDTNNDTIRCFLAPEGSYINFKTTTIVPIGGLTSADDKNPVSMELQNVPEQIQMGDDLETVLADVTAVVTFEEDVTKTVTADELTFSVVPDMTSPGEKTLVAVYNKTYNGENCDTPVVASATITVISNVVSIAVTSAPTYYYYTTTATEGLSRTMAFYSSDVVVTATYEDGSTGVLSNSLLTFSSDDIYAAEGTYEFTVKYGDLSATSYVNVEEVSTAVQVTNDPVGDSSFSASYLGDYSNTFSVSGGETKSISFTNYTNGNYNWNNFIVVMCEDGDTNTLVAVCRADDYMVTGTCLSNGYSDDRASWDAWLAVMNGAKVTVYVTNCNNGTADVQCVMVGTDSNTYTQYYLGVDISELSDPAFAMSIEAAYLVFD